MFSGESAMGNHSGGYMLNEVIGILEEAQVFQWLGEDPTRALLLKLVDIGQDYGCSNGEILEGYGERFKMCYCCLCATSDLEEDLCARCRREEE
jgi:hypothetical protein